jgi:hypothetical protein
MFGVLGGSDDRRYSLPVAKCPAPRALASTALANRQATTAAQPAGISPAAAQQPCGRLTPGKEHPKNPASAACPRPLPRNFAATGGRLVFDYSRGNPFSTAIRLANPQPDVSHRPRPSRRRTARSVSISDAKNGVE